MITLIIVGSSVPLGKVEALQSLFEPLGSSMLAPLVEMKVLMRAEPLYLYDSMDRKERKLPKLNRDWVNKRRHATAPKKEHRSFRKR